MRVLPRRAFIVFTFLVAGLAGLAGSSFTSASGPCIPAGSLELGSASWTCDGSTILGHSTTGKAALLLPGTYTDFVFTADVSTTNREASLFFRTQDAENTYVALFEPDGLGFGGGIWFEKTVNGTGNFLAYAHPNPYPQPGEPAHVEIRAAGSRFKVFLNGIQVADVNDATYSSGRVGLRVFGDNSVPDDARFQNVTLFPDFKQGALPWGSARLRNDNSCPTMAAEGCAVTDVADVIRALGVTTLADGSPTNPGNLNTWLANNGGFGSGSSYCQVIWSAAQSASHNLVEYVPGLSRYARRDTSPYPNSLINQALDANSANLVVALVRNNAGGWHYVVVTSHHGNTFSFLDPFVDPNPSVVGSGTDLLAKYNAHPGIFQFLVFGPGDQVAHASLSLRGHSPIEILVTNESGQRTGYDASTDSVLGEIQNSAYGLDYPPSDDLGVLPDSPPLLALDIGDASSETYAVQVVGTGNGPYSLDFVGTGESGQARTTTISGSATQGSIDNYTVSFDSSAPDPITAVSSSSTPAAVGGSVQLAVKSGHESLSSVWWILAATLSCSVMFATAFKLSKRA